jgi:Uma2 family endonuclease
MPQTAQRFFQAFAQGREPARTDSTAKKALYEGFFHTPEYFWFSPETLEFAGFHLVDGRYTPIVPDAAGRLRALGVDPDLA